MRTMIEDIDDDDGAEAVYRHGSDDEDDVVLHLPWGGLLKMLSR